MAKRLEIRGWRVLETVDGCFLFFDPKKEHVRLFEGMDPRGVKEPATRLEEELQGWVQGHFDFDDQTSK